MKHPLISRVVALLLAGFACSRLGALEPIPPKLVVLTFDDTVASQYSVVRPLLKQFGFKATFFISEGFSFPTNKRDYMTWAQIKELNDDGFEIGNHTRDHMGVSPQTLGRLREQIEPINARCAEYGIPRPVSFAYPGNAITPGAIPILKELGFKFARRGGAPEQAYEWGRGSAFEPGRDHPLLLPSAGDARPDWTIADFRRAVDQARDGRIAILQFHGVPDNEHPWVNTRPERFAGFMDYLHTNHFQVIALRDLARFVDPDAAPADPLAIVRERQAAREEVLVEGEVLNEAGGKPLPSRVYIQGADGQWFFPKSDSAVRYERRNGNNPGAVEMHTTLSANPFKVELKPGQYTFTIEHGKEFFPETRTVTVTRGMPRLTFRLRQWISMPERGWYSGDTHNHRDPAELPNNLLAEDVNVALPMVDWTTTSSTAPSKSGRGFAGDFADAPVNVDATHAWYARNSEYEIFNVGSRSHMLGALLILNHHSRFDQTVFPLQSVAAKARAEGALLDLEKHNWPWSMALAALLKVDLFELANNHHWETHFAITNWAVPAPAWMGLAGSGSENERDWALYGFQTYYALLDCGFHLRPAAGTANGVHPVPLGFSRVYVHLDEPFSFDAWMRGLNAGRSFVTTGPMFLQAGGQLPGGTITVQNPGQSFPLLCLVRSEQPLESIELIVNGQAFQKFAPENQRLASGAYETQLTTNFTPATSSWIAWRCFEKRPGGRIRFAHTAPTYFDLPGKPLIPRRVEADWLVSRVKEEIARSQGIVPESLIEDYRRALAIYEAIAAKAR